jgi:hypothetical protein
MYEKQQFDDWYEDVYTHQQVADGFADLCQCPNYAHSGGKNAKSILLLLLLLLNGTHFNARKSQRKISEIFIKSTLITK